MKVIIKTLEKMPKHTRGKPGAGMYLYDFVCVYIWTYIIFIFSKFFVYEHTSFGIVLGHVVAPKSELGLYMFVFLQFRS